MVLWLVVLIGGVLGEDRVSGPSPRALSLLSVSKSGQQALGAGTPALPPPEKYFNIGKTPAEQGLRKGPVPYSPNEWKEGQFDTFTNVSGIFYNRIDSDVTRMASEAAQLKAQVAALKTRAEALENASTALPAFKFETRKDTMPTIALATKNNESTKVILKDLSTINATVSTEAAKVHTINASLAEVADVVFAINGLENGTKIINEADTDFKRVQDKLALSNKSMGMIQQRTNFTLDDKVEEEYGKRIGTLLTSMDVNMSMVAANFSFAFNASNATNVTLLSREAAGRRTLGAVTDDEIPDLSDDPSDQSDDAPARRIVVRRVDSSEVLGDDW
uniref:Uncharacterized protein n=1 Tax=Oxyrrhis marina TaxID=2969 RepID=A0A7S4LQ92_OXYMA|mmetsp:Transcript_68055/g.181047  ORF Transcript_68055/g.181047 Transcript_68055/m.181047 type:complete len:333 (+) Transcript_68055:148-1146(+)